MPDRRHGVAEVPRENRMILDRLSPGRAGQQPRRRRGPRIRGADFAALISKNQREGRRAWHSESSNGAPATSAATPCARFSGTPSSSWSGCTSTAPKKAGATPASCAACRRSACTPPTTSTRCSPSTPIASRTPGPATDAPSRRSTTWRRILRSGKNVVSTSVVGSCIRDPATIASRASSRRHAVREGGTSFFTSGIDPGFANDLLPLMLSGLCGALGRGADPRDRQLRHLRPARGALRHDGLRQAHGPRSVPADARGALLRLGRRRSGCSPRVSGSRSTRCARCTSADPRRSPFGSATTRSRSEPSPPALRGPGRRRRQARCGGGARHAARRRPGA